MSAPAIRSVSIDAACLLANVAVAIVTPHEWLRIVALVLCGWYARQLAERLP